MKKFWVLLIVAAFASFSVVAQETKDYKQDRTEWEKKIKDELKLTPEQTQKYDALNSEYNPKFDAIMNDASLTKDVQKERKMALKKEKEAKMMEFLTPEQQTKYRELVDKKTKEMEKHQEKQQ